MRPLEGALVLTEEAHGAPLTNRTRQALEDAVRAQPASSVHQQPEMDAVQPKTPPIKTHSGTSGSVVRRPKRRFSSEAFEIVLFSMIISFASELLANPNLSDRGPLQTIVVNVYDNLLMLVMTELDAFGSIFRVECVPDNS